MPDNNDVILRTILLKVEHIERSVNELLEMDYIDDAPLKTKVDDDRFIGDDEIYKLGHRIPYSRIMDRNDVHDFRTFIEYIRTHETLFSAKEIDYAGFADKNFSDIRLSDNTRRILGQAFIRIYKQAWNFKFQRGSMIKYRNQISWEWSDGSRD